MRKNIILIVNEKKKFGSHHVSTSFDKVVMLNENPRSKAIENKNTHVFAKVHKIGNMYVSRSFGKVTKIGSLAVSRSFKKVRFYI